jgi:hypothetical protein
MLILRLIYDFPMKFRISLGHILNKSIRFLACLASEQLLQVYP